MTTPAFSVASSVQPTVPGPLAPIGHEKLTVDATAGGVTLASVPTSGPVVCAVLTLETAQIRYWSDGTAPTSTDGVPMNAGDQIVLASTNLALFHAIRTGGSSGVLWVEYWGYP